ncbi:hypothetical protein FM120_11520 [Sphingobacterium faecium PCAi_F2.5]|nr:hypothetical protein FM120_11520 [Sphingobacterium faecium PCAi_F2.5]
MLFSGKKRSPYNTLLRFTGVKIKMNEALKSAVDEVQSSYTN